MWWSLSERMWKMTKAAKYLSVYVLHRSFSVFFLTIRAPKHRPQLANRLGHYFGQRLEICRSRRYYYYFRTSGWADTTGRSGPSACCRRTRAAAWCTTSDAAGLAWKASSRLSVASVCSRRSRARGGSYKASSSVSVRSACRVCWWRRNRLALFRTEFRRPCSSRREWFRRVCRSCMVSGSSSDQVWPECLKIYIRLFIKINIFLKI